MYRAEYGCNTSVPLLGLMKEARKIKRLVSYHKLPQDEEVNIEVNEDKINPSDR
jgi:hypothetical protein